MPRHAGLELTCMTSRITQWMTALLLATFCSTGMAGVPNQGAPGGIGGTGHETKVPDLPETPDVPERIEVPELPDAVDTSDSMSIPETAPEPGFDIDTPEPTEPEK
jgi:hypothetical protein